jgi:hypothetical protein
MQREFSKKAGFILRSTLVCTANRHTPPASTVGALQETLQGGWIHLKSQ